MFVVDPPRSFHFLSHLPFSPCIYSAIDRFMRRVHFLSLVDILRHILAISQIGLRMLHARLMVLHL